MLYVKFCYFVICRAQLPTCFIKRQYDLNKSPENTTQTNYRSKGHATLEYCIL